jgi:hypothetical protein
MTARDEHGLILSGADTAAAEHYQQALRSYHCYGGYAPGLVVAAIAASPGFVMAHVLKAYLNLLGGNAEGLMVGAAAFESAKALPPNDREQGHIAALGNLCAGELRAAGRILEDVAIHHPRDVLALQAGQLVDFLLGDSRMLRDRIGRAAPSWSADMPGYHAVLGMHAFGLEETALYDRAEAAGCRALELEPRNGWAKHAVAHVLEMQDRRAEGVAFMRADIPNWTDESFFAVHNWWHLALFHLGLGDVDEVLRLYDGPIYGAASDLPFDMVDAAAMLWRLELKGVDVGDRWARLADVYATQPRGLYAFDDAHAMMAFVGAGREGAARGLLELQTTVLSGPGDNATFTGLVGRPVMRAIHAFGQGDYTLAVDLLRDVRNHAARFGGSHAQRDLLDLTLIEAARRNGDQSLVRALLAERDRARPAAASSTRRLAA